MSSPIVPPTKTCSKCGIEYPATNSFFYASADGKLNARCRECIKTASRNAYHKPEVKERVLNQHHTAEYRRHTRDAARKRRQSLDPIKREIILTKARARYHKPEVKQRVLAYMAARYRKIYPPGSRPGRQRNIASWRENNRRNSEKYRNRKKALPMTFTDTDAAFLMAYFNDSCAVCGCKESDKRVLVFDHWIPISNPDCPGTTSTNTVVLCHSMEGDKGGCNNLKWHYPPVEWLTQRYGDNAMLILKRINDYFDLVAKRKK